jgi:hypothetical protein
MHAHHVCYTVGVTMPNYAKCGKILQSYIFSILFSHFKFCAVSITQFNGITYAKLHYYCTVRP